MTASSLTTVTHDETLGSACASTLVIAVCALAAIGPNSEIIAAQKQLCLQRRLSVSMIAPLRCFVGLPTRRDVRALPEHRRVSYCAFS
jgi:hypothetical protein